VFMQSEKRRGGGATSAPPAMPANPSGV
jgi:hypothetical protein